MWHDDLFRFTLESFSQFHYTQLKELFVGLVHLLLILYRKALVDTPIGDVDVVDVGYVLVARDAKDVNIVDGMTHHLAPTDEALQCQILLLYFLCFFK